MSLTKIQKLPDQEYLKILFLYNPETGSLKWAGYFDIEVLSAYGWKQRRIRRMNSTIAGKEAELTYNYHENHGRACNTETPVV